MKSIVSSEDLVAYCGLYCGACPSYLKERCPGCHGNEKASWCTVRSCCKEHNYATCAQCMEFSDPMECGKYNNFFSKIIGFLFRSDRAACIRQIKELGAKGHADSMAAQKRQTIKRGAGKK